MLIPSILFNSHGHRITSAVACICILTLLACSTLNCGAFNYHLQCEVRLFDADGKEIKAFEDTIGVVCILPPIFMIYSEGLNLELVHDYMGSMNTGTSSSQSEGKPTEYTKRFNAQDCTIMFSSTYDYVHKTPIGTFPDKYTSFCILYPTGEKIKGAIKSITDVDTRSTVSVSTFFEGLIEGGKKMNSAREDCVVLHIDKELGSSTETPLEAVDLGLSVRWAPFNVGETKPYGRISTFGWADPTGHKRGENNNDFPSANPPLHIGGTQYDAATVNWGKHWRLPTRQECQELIDRCRFVEMRNNNGVVFALQCIGPNGNSIVLPYLDNCEYGSYWTEGSSSQKTCGAYEMVISSDSWFRNEVNDSNNRFCKFMIRPVYVP